QAGEVGRLVDSLGEPGEEAVHLPTDGLPQQLVLPAREQPVDRGARNARFLDDVVDGGLAHAEAGHARVRGGEDALARFDLPVHGSIITRKRPAPMEGGPLRLLRADGNGHLVNLTVLPALEV